MPERVEIDGDEILQKKLTAFELQLRDLRPFWPTVRRLWIRWLGQQFTTEGAFFGDPWAPLSAKYAAEKAIRHPGKGILVAEGDLKKGATNPKTKATATHLELDIEWIKKGKKLDPAWHQHGNTQGMPARPILPVNDDLPPQAEHDLDEAAEDYVKRAARAAGLLAN